MPGLNDDTLGGNNDFDMDAAIADIGDGLGFGPDDPSDNLDDPSSLDGGSGAKPAAGEPASDKPTPEGEGTPPTTDPAAPTVTNTAPRTWRAEAAAHWANLPPEVQAEIAKREEDIFKGIEGYKADAHYGKTMQSVMAPYDNVMKQYNIDPVQQVAGLMNAHYTLALGTPEAKVNLLKSLITDYQIDTSALFGQQPSDNNPYTDPEVLALREEIASLKSTTSNLQNERLAQQRKEIDAEVGKFVADPANIYVKDLVNDMVQLLNTNRVATVKDAYEQAMWLNPAVRAKEIARQQTEQAAKAAKEAEEKAAAAKKATAANVRSSAKRGGAAAPVGSMDDTLAETLAAIQSRA